MPMWYDEACVYHNLASCLHCLFDTSYKNDVNKPVLSYFLCSFNST